MTASGDHPAPFALPVLSCASVGGRQTLLRLDARGTKAQMSHTVPGQFVHLTLDGVARPYALASAPGADAFELLLRMPAARADALGLRDEGCRIETSAAMGPGFPMARAPGRALWLCATGTGIAPMRAVVLALPPGPLARITVLYGVRDAEDVAFADDLAAFKARGANVVVTVSGGEAQHPYRGYVQDHLPAAFADPSAVEVFVAGLPAMERDLTAALAARGVQATQVHRNW